MNFFNKNKLVILALVSIIFLFPGFVLAQTNRCSPVGYTILTINGVLTNESGAKENRDRLQDHLPDTFNSQPLTIDYLLNPTHAGGVLDFITAFNQGYFSEKSDYDLTEMLSDASIKLKTEKVLLVGHSQGNFYANNFYNKVVDKDGGIPKDSIRVYSVATPAHMVADDPVPLSWEYTTSDTDKVINNVAGAVLYKLPSNAHIDLHPGDDNLGHNFSGIYLKYQSEKIVSDITTSLNKLESNNIQDDQKPCMNPPKLSIFHKVEGAGLAVIDTTVNTYNNTLGFVGQKYLAFVDSTGKLLAGVFGGSGNVNTSAVILADADNSNPNQQNSPVTESPKVAPQTEVIPQPVTHTEKSTPALVIDTNTETKISTPAETPKTNQPILSTPHLFVNNNVAALSGGGGGTNTVTVEAPVIPEPTPEPPIVIDPVVPPPVVDTTPPVITITGDITMTIPLNSKYTDLGAIAVDDIDGNISVTTTGEVDTSTSQIYNISYTATDVAGNTTTKIRRVSVDSGAKLSRPNYVFISGNYAYVVSQLSNSLEIIDITNPSTPIHKSSITHGTDGATLVSPSAVFVSGNYAYVTSSLGNALEIIDISDPLHPVHQNTFLSSDDGSRFVNPTAITISQNYAYIVARGSQNVEILDITDPIHPRHKASYSPGALVVPSAISISGNYMYLTYSCLCNGGGSLQVIDISDPTHPVLKSQINDGTDGINLYYPADVFVSGNYAYEITSSTPYSMNIIDVSDSNNPIFKGVINDGDAALSFPNSVVVSGNYAYITSFNGSTLEVIDISDPVHPIHQSTISDGDSGALLYYPKNVFVKDNYAYISSSMSNALEIVDISDPIHPTHVGKIIDGGF